MEAITLNDLFNAGFEQNKDLILKIFNSNKIKYFREACINGNLDLVKFMVENGADIQENKNYPIQFAIAHRHLEIVKYLIEKGANVLNDDNLALRRASSNGHLEVVKLLIEHGADVKTCDNYSIERASKNGHLEVVKILIDHGAEVTDEIINNAKDNVKEYLKSIKNIVYYGFVSKDKLDIKLPDLLEINKNNQYYYVYKMTRCDCDNQGGEESSYYLEDLLDKQKILLSLTNNNSNSLKTFVKI